MHDYYRINTVSKINMEKFHESKRFISFIVIDPVAVKGLILLFV